MAQNTAYYLPHLAVFRIRNGKTYTDIPVEKSDMARGDFVSVLEDAFNARGKLPSPVTADFVLPHNLYGVDFVTLPNIKRGQVEDAYKAELRSRFKNYDQLTFLKSEIFLGKTVTYRVIFARKDLLAQIKEGFSKFGVTIDKFIPMGCAVIEGALKSDSAVKKAPSLILNIGENESYIAVYGKDTLLGGMPIQFGVKALSDSRLVYERQLFHRDAAELLVINAKERAKATKLTMAIDLEEEIDDSIPDEEDEIEPNPELPDLTAMGKDAPEQVWDDKTDDDENVPAVKTLRRSAIRVLPKFMRREEPTSPNGYVIENFRMFEKRLLMLARDMALTEFYPKIENIFLAMPKEFDFIVPVMKNDNHAYKWFRLNDYDEELFVSGALRAANGKLPVF